jgi:hypothetical protein
MKKKTLTNYIGQSNEKQRNMKAKKKKAKQRSDAIKRTLTFPSSLCCFANCVSTREFAHVSSLRKEEERKRTAEAGLSLRRRSTKCTTQDNDVSLFLSHSLPAGLMYTKKTGEKKSSFFIILLFYIVSGQLTTNWRKIGKVTFCFAFGFFFFFFY